MAEPIAIVGTACRFSGSASSPSKLWELLKAPRDVSCSFPPERLNFANFYHKDGEVHGCTDVQQRSYLLQEDIRLFDAAFFRVNPKEAAGLDPQQRILLETLYEAFEAAGWPLMSMEGSQTSVYVGVMTDDYATIQSRDPDTMGSHAATGLSRSILANRVSYVFDLKGPSMSVDTACSSSLVALHLAVQGLRNGEAAQAIVAGTNLLLDPHWFITESSLHMLSPDSQCRMWDKDANGYARGEGCAVMVLKPLSKAIQDGDGIECIIRETGINSDGRTQGLTMPNPTSQTALIRKTYQSAGLDPITDRCQYFECHGTGTQAGDTAEARAIRDAFFHDATSEQTTPLYCGSIKTVLGHLEGCAGLAGLIKASLAIQHGLIPPNMHFNELNPLIEPFYGNLCIPTSLLTWPQTNGAPRRASINSFGFGGSNGHVILESYKAPCEPIPLGANAATADESKSEPELESTPVNIGPFVFSAKSRASLEKSLTRMLNHVDQTPTLSLDNLSYVLHSKRTVFSHRVAIPAVKGRQGLMEALRKQISMAVSTTDDGSFGIRGLEETATGHCPRTLGIFTGQVTQAELSPLSTERFNRAVSAIGLHYEGVFRSMTSLSRSWGHARATASWDQEDLNIRCTLHPAVLDVAFQAGLATFVSNAENALGSSYLPVGLRRVITDPQHAYQDPSGRISMDIEAMMTVSTSSAVEVDINACATTSGHNSTCGIQVEGLILKSVDEPQAVNDRNIFVKTIWDVDCSSSLSLSTQPRVDMKEAEQRIEAHERLALFYLRNLVSELGSEQVAAAKWHHQAFVHSINATLLNVHDEQHTPLRKEWLSDSSDTIKALSINRPDDVDIEMLTRVGETLPSVVRGECEMMEHMLREGLLKRFYKEGRGLIWCNQGVAHLLRQISHNYPRIKIIEVGAGTGGTTLGVLEAIGAAYASYTFTDILSSLFNEMAQEIPSLHSPRVEFKVFDVEKPPATQGFLEGGYDVVIAANVLHATRRLSETVQNVRSLLRPGGYLIAVEVTGSMLRETALMGALEGWWLGVEEGRTTKPGICAKEWDDLLRKSGFSGIDCVSHDHHDASKHSCSVFATQAMDTGIDIIRQNGLVDTAC